MPDAPLPEKTENKTTRVDFRARVSDKELWQQAAAQAKRKLGDWITLVLNDAAERSLAKKGRGR